MLHKTFFIVIFCSLAVLGVKSGAKCASYPALWNVPLRNEYYIKRGNILEEIKLSLREKEPILTLVGMTGSGKTQLTKEFAHKSYKNYEIVWWIDASKDLDLQFKDFALAWNDKIPDQPIPVAHLSSKALVNYVKDKLRLTSKRWLLIFDNASHKDSIKEYFPETHGKAYAHILITSQNQTTWNTMLPIKKLARAESLTLVQRIVGKRAEKEDTNMLAELLGDFPLALSQAAVYLKSCPSLTIQEYIRLFKKMHKRVWEDETKLVKQHGESLMEYKEASSTALKLSVSEILKESEEAYDLLLFTSFLAPNRIPYPLLKKFLKINEKDSLPDQVISVLEKRLLLNRDDSQQQEVPSYGIHEMLQLVVRDSLSREQKQAFIARASQPFLASLDDRLPSEEKLGWESVLQHVKTLMGFAQEEFCRSLEVLKLRILFLNYILGDRREIQESRQQLDIIEPSLKEEPLKDPFYKALYHINKGNFLIWGNADYPPALEHQRKALKLLENVSADGDQKLRALTQLAQYSLLEGDIETAKTYLAQGQIPAERAKDIATKALYHYGKAFYCLFTMAYEEGLQEIEVSLSLLRSSSCPALAFSAELIKADLLLRMEKRQAAYKHSKEIFKKAKVYYQNTNNMFCAKALMLTAAAMPHYNKQGNKALMLLRSATSIFEKLSTDPQGKHRRQGWTCVLLGDIYAGRGEWEKAHENYKQAESIYDTIYKSKELGEYSDLYLKLALLGAKIKNDEIAHTYLKKHTQVFGLAHPRTKEIFHHLDSRLD